MKGKKEDSGKEIIVVLTLLLIAFFITLALYLIFSNVNPERSQVKSENTVTRIIDGDTFELMSGEKVRLICVDTPEEGSQGYMESKEFLSSLILNKEVILEKDVSDKDSFGRLLRYVYVNITDKLSCGANTQDSQKNSISAETCIGSGEVKRELFVNKELVKKGYAEVFPYGNDTKRCSEIAQK